MDLNDSGITGFYNSVSILLTVYISLVLLSAILVDDLR